MGQPATGGGRSPSANAFTSAAVVVCGSLPAFLTGALAVMIRSSFGLSALGLGVCVAAFRAAAAVTSVPLGRMGHKLGPSASMRIALLVSLGSAACIGLWAPNSLMFAVFLAVSGLGYALGQTSANAFIASSVDPGRQGAAFGLKAAAMPAAAMLAGAAVPSIAVGLGWRSTFLAAAAVSLAVLLLVPSAPRTSTKGKRPVGRLSMPLPTLIVLGAALGLGIAAASATSTFIVDAAVRAGMSQGAGAGILTVGSALAIICRVITGNLADRREGGHFRIVMQMLGLGAIGYLLLASGSVYGIAVGALLALGVGWGFNGLFWYAVVRLNPGSAAPVTGVVMPLGLIGGIGGPVVTGWLIDAASYRVAWLVIALWMLVAVAAIAVGRHLHRRSKLP